MTPDVHPAYLIRGEPVELEDGTTGFVLVLQLSLYPTWERACEAADVLGQVVHVMLEKEASGPLN